MISKLKEIGSTEFPEFTGERVYMQEFLQKEGLPGPLKRWQATIDSMLSDIQTDGPIYLMIDQREVTAGSTHRRGGIHIDGNWIPAIKSHGGGGVSVGRHANAPMPHGRHVNTGSHNAPTPRGSHYIDVPGWNTNGLYPEAIRLAANIEASRAFVGEFDGEFGEGGSADNINLSKLEAIPLLANKIYSGNVFMLHETSPIPVNCLRTVVRLNIPGVEI